MPTTTHRRALGRNRNRQAGLAPTAEGDDEAAQSTAAPGQKQKKQQWRFLSDWEHHNDGDTYFSLSNNNTEHYQPPALTSRLPQSTALVPFVNSTTSAASTAASARVTGSLQPPQQQQLQQLIVRAPKPIADVPENNRKKGGGGAAKMAPPSLLSASTDLIVPSPSSDANAVVLAPSVRLQPLSESNYLLARRCEADAQRKKTQHHRDEAVRRKTHHKPAATVHGAVSLLCHNPPLTTGPLRAITYDQPSSEASSSSLVLAQHPQQQQRRTSNDGKKKKKKQQRGDGRSSNSIASVRAADKSAALCAIPEAQRKTLEAGLAMKMIPRSAVPFLLPRLTYRQPTTGSVVSNELMRVAVDQPWLPSAQQRVIDSCMATASAIQVAGVEPPVEIVQSVETMMNLRQLYATLHPASEEIQLASSDCPEDVRQTLSVVKLPRGGGTFVVPVETEESEKNSARDFATSEPILMARGPLAPMEDPQMPSAPLSEQNLLLAAPSDDDPHQQQGGGGDGAPPEHQRPALPSSSSAALVPLAKLVSSSNTSEESARLKWLRKQQHEAEVRFGISAPRHGYR